MNRLYRNRGIADVAVTKARLSDKSFRLWQDLQRTGGLISSSEAEGTIRFKKDQFYRALKALWNHLADLERGKHEDNSSRDVPPSSKPDGRTTGYSGEED